MKEEISNTNFINVNQTKKWQTTHTTKKQKMCPISCQLTLGIVQIQTKLSEK